MGRPINPRYLGDVAGSIKVSHHYRVGQSEVAGGEDTYIVKQKSANKFEVADTSSGWTEVLTLVNKAAGALAEGEFRIDATQADGTPSNVTRLYNRTVRIDGNSKIKWNINVPAALTITGITQANPAVVTVADTSTLTTGEEIYISGVVGMTEVNDANFTITVINGTTFSLDSTDATGYTAYTSGGTVDGVGDIAGIDTQAS